MKGFGQFVLAGGAILALLKSLSELWSPNTLRYKKVYKTKKFPFDEIYLECGLRFELKSIV